MHEAGLAKKHTGSVYCGMVGIVATLDHSRARCLTRTALRSSAYKAPMNEPMEVPPTMSMGMPASSMALITPTCEHPL